MLLFEAESSWDTVDEIIPNRQRPDNRRPEAERVENHGQAF